MKLSKNILTNLNGAVNSFPQSELFDLPEKVLQFGTGVLLRALPDYFIDKANKLGIFNGRVVVVKSTDGDSSAFDKQDCLYTICVRGVEKGEIVNENIVNASVSRVLNAKTEWRRILHCAHNPELKIIISNTTEVGIQFFPDEINSEPPDSFPGKLLAFLFERYKAFNGNPENGIVIIPTELISDNGSKLESIVLELAHLNNLDFKFIEWLELHNTFCNSLVDRIVPGKPAKEDLIKLEAELGYEDDLLTMSEVFRLWAIEGDEKVKQELSFLRSDDGIIISPDITLYKELKLRLLNGTHTFNCGTAFLCGFNITREAISDPVYSEFTQSLMHFEIVPSIPFEIEEKIKIDFAKNVFERFCNPFIDHQWQSITVQYTSKMRMRNIPLLKTFFEKKASVPSHMALGFAAFILYMKAEKKEGNRFYGLRKEHEYEIIDDSAEYFFQLWQQYAPADVAEQVLKNLELWNEDLTRLHGFLPAVQENLEEMIVNGVRETVTNLVSKKVVV